MAAEQSHPSAPGKPRRFTYGRWARAEVSLVAIERRLWGLHDLLLETGQPAAALATRNLLADLDDFGRTLARRAMSDG